MRTAFEIEIEELDAAFVFVDSGIPVSELLGKVVIRAKLLCENRRCILETKPFHKDDSEAFNEILGAVKTKMFERLIQLKSKLCPTTQV